MSLCGPSAAATDGWPRGRGICGARLRRCECGPRGALARWAPPEVLAECTSVPPRTQKRRAGAHTMCARRARNATTQTLRAHDLRETVMCLCTASWRPESFAARRAVVCHAHLRPDCEVHADTMARTKPWRHSSGLPTQTPLCRACGSPPQHTRSVRRHAGRQRATRSAHASPSVRCAPTHLHPSDPMAP